MKTGSKLGILAGLAIGAAFALPSAVRAASGSGSHATPEYADVYFDPFPGQSDYQLLVKSDEHCHGTGLEKIIGMVGNVVYRHRGGPFHWTVGERFYFRVAVIRRAAFANSTCNNVSSFVPERGRAYHISQQIIGSQDPGDLGKIKSCVIHVTNDDGQTLESYVSHPLEENVLTGVHCKTTRS